MQTQILTEHGLILTSHENCPGGYGWWYIITFFYSTQANRAQIAVSYNGNRGRICTRHCYRDTWSPWAEMVSTSRTVNGKALTNDIVVDIPDIAGLNSALITIGSNISLGSPQLQDCLGRNVYSLGEESVAIGHYVNAGGDKSVALGTNANASNKSEGILGFQVKALVLLNG